MTAAPELTVHDEAIRANTAFFAERTGGRLMAVLKADGFGHGDVARAVIASGATSIGVTSVAEALSVRASGVDVPVLSWLNPVDADFDSAALAGIDVAVSSFELLAAVGRAARRTSRRVRVHLHVDVGMSRDGAPPGSWSALCAAAREFQCSGTIRVVAVMGHMSCADQPAHPQNVRERLVFENAVRVARRRGLSGFVTHLAATAATVTGVGAGFDVHRIGAGLFGIDPSGTAADLRNALSLTAPVVATREAPAGSGVGYGLEHVVDRPTHLALLPIGYGDGLPRVASGRAEVQVRGRRRPLVGRFSMDMVVVDTGGDRLAPGETATLFGTGDDGAPTVSDWAGWADTIPHEIVTGIGARVARTHRFPTVSSVVPSAVVPSALVPSPEESPVA